MLPLRLTPRLLLPALLYSPVLVRFLLARPCLEPDALCGLRFLLVRLLLPIAVVLLVQSLRTLPIHVGRRLPRTLRLFLGCLHYAPVKLVLVVPSVRPWFARFSFPVAHGLCCRCIARMGCHVCSRRRLVPALPKLPAWWSCRLILTRPWNGSASLKAVSGCFVSPGTPVNVPFLLTAPIRSLVTLWSGIRGSPSPGTRSLEDHRPEEFAFIFVHTFVYIFALLYIKSTFYILNKLLSSQKTCLFFTIA